MAERVLLDPYFADGYLLEAAAVLASANASQPDGRRVHPGVVLTVNTALAAEAHINLALTKALSGVELDKAMRLDVIGKLLLGPRIALGRAVFDAGSPPITELREVIRRRNDFVHPRPPRWRIREDGGKFHFAVPAMGVDLRVAARGLASLCRYLDRLEAAGGDVWKGQGWLARELLSLGNQMRRWDAAMHAPKMAALVERLTDFIPDAPE